MEVELYEARMGSMVKQVVNEVWRAKKKFPTDFHNQHEGIAVLWEEIDELWDEVKKNQRDYDLVAQKKEAIQCAAMCFRFLVELVFSEQSSS